MVSEFDSNGDERVDKLDARFGELLLWQDRNADGVTDAGELSNASQSGLESISTQFSSQNIYQHGNLLGEVSTAVWQGHTVEAIDVYFRYGKGKDSEGSSSGINAGKNNTQVARSTDFVASGGSSSFDVAHSLVGAVAAFGASTASDAVETFDWRRPAPSARAGGHADLAAW